MELINASTGDKLKVLKYAAPSKAAAGKITLNGEEVETRFTSARGKEYTYFPVGGVSLYVAGKLEDGSAHTLEVPEGLKGPAWEGARKSYYVRKRPAKEAVTQGEGDAQSDNQTESGTAGSADSSSGSSGAGEATSEVEGASGESGVTEAPKSRRRRSE